MDSRFRRNEKNIGLLSSKNISEEQRMSSLFDPARRTVLAGAAALAVASVLPRRAYAADPLNVGLILPMSGPFASTGKQIDAAVKLYLKRNGDTAGGRKVNVIL